MTFASDLAAREAALRSALRRAPGDSRAAAALADLLLAAGRQGEAETLLAALVASGRGDLHALTAAADVQKAAGRPDAAIALYARARAAAPKSAVAEHNLAGALGDAQRFAEARAAATAAFAKGLDAPETWLVLARALQGVGELDEAERAYGEAVRRRPGFAEALGDLAQLIWMRTGALADAQAPLDEALSAHPGLPALLAKKAHLLEYAGEAEAAWAVAAEAARRAPGDWTIRTLAAQLASELDPEAALVHARAGVEIAPQAPAAQITLCQAQLAAGRPREAEQTASALRASSPEDQHAIALLATAWRLLDDPRYRDLYDYERFVSAQTIDTPPGWSRLPDYVAELAEALERRHLYRAHPIGQSVRGGSQTEQTLTLSEDPVIQAFLQAIDEPIRLHIARLGAGDDPLRRRIRTGYQLLSVWSVRLAPGGSHTNHVHPKGWLSSACYIQAPAAVDREREGWLKFGEPGIATNPSLAPETYLRPSPGTLVLFPSYMWHGVVPFGGHEPRLTIAFDVAPA